MTVWWGKVTTFTWGGAVLLTGGRVCARMGQFYFLTYTINFFNPYHHPMRQILLLLFYRQVN